MKKTAKKIVAGTVGAAGLFLASAATAVNADSVHHVVKNDTVWALSQKYGVSIKSIEQLNHIDQNTNMIYVGQDLQIPNKDTQTPKKDNEQTYVVQSGDSLWTIAQKFNTTVDQLRQLNGLTSNLIQPGQTLKVSGQAVAQPAKTQASVKVAEQPAQQKAAVTTQKAPVVSSTQASVSTEKAAPVQNQVVQSTVKSAPAVQSSVNTQAPVVSTSSSSTQTAVTSQSSSATVKSSSTSTVQSSVASSSTSSSSSQQAGVSSSSSSKQVVSSSSASSQSSSKQAVIAANHINYTVKSGDTLYTIAQAYGVTVSSLKEANPNLGASLIAGQTIIINNPTKNPTAVSSQSQSSRVQSSSQSVVRPQQTQTASSASQQQATQQNTQQQNNNNQAAQASSQAQASSTTRTGSGSNVVSFAESLIGVPYVYGGTTPSGFDCSGFVQYVYGHFGVNLPRTTTQQENCGTQIPVSQAQPGDLYFWGSKGSTYHVAICIGNGKYIAAPEPGQSVSIGSTQYFQPSFAVRL